jgi:hypothetical protein
LEVKGMRQYEFRCAKPEVGDDRELEAGTDRDAIDLLSEREFKAVQDGDARLVEIREVPV